MNEFKAGDKVQLKSGDDGEHLMGGDRLLHGVVYEVTSASNVVSVKIEGDSHDGWNVSHFELVPAKTKTERLKLDSKYNLQPGDVVEAGPDAANGWNIEVKREVPVPVSEDFVVPKGWRQKRAGDVLYSRQVLDFKHLERGTYTWVSYVREDEDA